MCLSNLSICPCLSICLSFYLYVSFNVSFYCLSMCLSVYLCVCLSVYLSDYRSIWLSNLSVCRSVCLSVCPSVRPSVCRPSVRLSEEGILPEFLEKWQVTDPKRNHCAKPPNFGTCGRQKEAILRDFLNFGLSTSKTTTWKVVCRANGLVPMALRFFYPISLRLPRQREARSYEVLHLSCKAISANLKIRRFKLQPSLRKSLAWPNISDKNVSCTARATRNAALQVIEKLFRVHEMDWIVIFCDQLTLQIRYLCVRWLICLTLSIKIAVLMDAHLPIFWPSGWRYIPTCQKFTWETSWKCDIILTTVLHQHLGWSSMIFTWRRVQDLAFVPWDECIKISETGCYFYCSAAADVDSSHACHILPSVLQLLQYPHVELTFAKVQNPLRLPHSMTVKRPKVVRTCGVLLLTFYFKNRNVATMAWTFWTS